MCSHLAEALVKCHEDFPIKKFFGECNEAKAMMDACFREEKIVKRDENLARARAQDARWEAMTSNRAVEDAASAAASAAVAKLRSA